MNRAFLLIFVPAVLVAGAYIVVTAYLGAHLNYTRFLGAAAGFIAAVAIVHFYRRRKAGPSGR